MRLFATIGLYGYIPFVLLLFALMRNRRHAVIAAYVIGWEFLPMDFIKLPILELSKVTTCSVGALLGMVLFDFKRIMTFRPRWYDLPMLVWCICPYFTSIQNDLGTYDGASSTATQTLAWGLPYFVGRVYFNDYEGLRELCIGIFVSALAYIPFCLFEIKMSPQLHRIVYGHFQHDFSQTQRWGGWRPMVFMQSGIALGMWMCMASMTGIWLWVTGSVRRIGSFPMGLLVAVLVVVTVLCKSLSSLLFMFMGLGVLFWIRWFRNALPLYVLIAIVPIYMVVRASGAWDGQNLIDAAKKSFGEERGTSLETRIKAENNLTQKALDPAGGCDLRPEGSPVEHDPWFGFGKWSPYLNYAPWRVGHIVDKRNDNGDVLKYFKDDAPTDGMWVITLGTFGLLGLISGTLSIQLPALLARKRAPLALWAHPLGAPVAVLAVMLALHMVDNLLNAMLNPIFILAIGGISALGTTGTKRLATRAAQPLSPFGPIAPTGPRGGPMGGAAGSSEAFPLIPGLQMPPTMPFGFPEPGEASPRQSSMRASASRTTALRPGPAASSRAAPTGSRIDPENAGLGTQARRTPRQ